MKSHEEHVQKFWSGVEKGSDCWEWKKALAPSGYGAIRWEGKTRTTHRVSWEIHYGAIPEGLLVCHRCDNRKCVRPDHLFLGTISDNNNDMFEKGRWTAKKPRNGLNNPMGKVTPEQVQEMKRLYATGEHTFKSLEKIFNISSSVIHRWVRS